MTASARGPDTTLLADAFAAALAEAALAAADAVAVARRAPRTLGETA